MQMTTDNRQFLLAQRIILFWTLASFAVMGCVLADLVPPPNHDVLRGVYGVFTFSALPIAAALAGLDTIAGKIGGAK
jgi:hypothetical protein